MLGYRALSAQKIGLHGLIGRHIWKVTSCTAGPDAISFQRRGYGVRTGRGITNPESADRFVRWLRPEERNVLRDALIRNEDVNKEKDNTTEAPASMKQLRLVAFAHSMPFVGFGFLDNAIMILAGEYIDSTLGVMFGISTMAAAALGNLVSDLCGLGLAGYVEVLASKFGYDAPPMNAEQMAAWQTRYATYMGRGIGVIVGCIIGMFPLLFINADDVKHHHGGTPESKMENTTTN